MDYYYLRAGHYKTYTSLLIGMMNSVKFEFTDDFCNCTLHLTPQYQVWSDRVNIEYLTRKIRSDLRDQSFAHIARLTNLIVRSLDYINDFTIDITFDSETKIIGELGIFLCAAVSRYSLMTYFNSNV